MVPTSKKLTLSNREFGLLSGVLDIHAYRTVNIRDSKISLIDAKRNVF